MANGDPPIKVKGGSIEITLDGTDGSGLPLDWTGIDDADQWTVSGTGRSVYLVEVELGNGKKVKIPKSHATVKASSGERIRLSSDGDTTTVKANVGLRLDTGRSKTLLGESTPKGQGEGAAAGSDF
jgi:hypothetical protein